MLLEEAIQETLLEEAVKPPMVSKIHANGYDGPDLEAGGTSIAGKEVAALKSVVEPILKPGMKIIDFGAGKYARNADYLRKKGFEVYAYDPFNGKSNSGWKEGEVSNKLPNGVKFDVGFTSFVLNVVKSTTESKIIGDLNKVANKTFHIVRNDIIPAVRKAVKSKPTKDFIAKHYDKTIENAEEMTDEQIADLAVFGYATSKGFQRLPMLEAKGFSLKKKTGGWKAYVK
jgi:hypothetical protein